MFDEDHNLIKVPIFKELGIMITTTLALVIITTVVFGTFMPVIRNCLFPPKNEDEMEMQYEEEDHPEIRLSEGTGNDADELKK